MFDDDNVDAVVIALPNHWHALATIWACQAGKDVYVEKPFSHDIWEGRQMVAAARKHDRMVQTGMQNRSSSNLADAFQYLRSGELGPIQLRARDRSIGPRAESRASTSRRRSPARSTTTSGAARRPWPR